MSIMMFSAFCLTMILVVGLIASLVISIVSPSHRIWPPPGQRTWQYFLVWTLTILAFLGFIVVGILDWNSLGWPAMIRWLVGCGMILIGNLLAWLGVAQLSLKTTSGAGGELVTEGLYRYTRNPQYLGDIVLLLGWIVLSASIWTIPLTLGGIVAFVLTPFAEEPWLAELHGAAYRSYQEETPRFLLR